MFRKIVIYVTLICFIVCIQGCTSRYAIPTEKLVEKPAHKNVTIETIDGDIYEFGHLTVHDDCIEGHALVYDDTGEQVVDSFLVSILLEDVESVRILRHDAAKTAWYTLLAVGVIAMVGFAIVVIALAGEEWY